MATFPQPLSALRVIIRGVSPPHSRPWHVWSIADHFERTFGKVVACQAPRTRTGRRYQPYLFLDFASPSSATAAVDACEKGGGQVAVELSKGTETAADAEPKARYSCHMTVERVRGAHDE